MTHFPTHALPSCPPGADPSTLVLAIDEWTGAAAVAELVRTFGGSPPPLELADRLEWLELFTAQHWDYRAGGERYDSKKTRYGEDVDQLVAQAAESLGLSGHNRPGHVRYRHVLVAGGAVRTCAARSAFAADLVVDGLDVEQVAGLGSLRPVTDRELGHARSLGLTGVQTEFDAMDAGLVRAFHLDPPVDDQLVPGAGSGGSRLRTYRSSGRSIQTLAAPSTEPATRRANTADTLLFWAEQVGRPEPADRILLVTTDLHVPFQHCDALRTLTLRYGCGVDTVGLEPTALADPLMRHAYEPSDVLQELRSAIRSMRALHTALLALRTTVG
ncbi:hypothetical protein PSH03_003654 [Micromonospora sp. PSH03]|uniref:hypothetical protein n=1 Tax=Micromonospora salmantinae TaxID=2911211 RepID=UPI001EE8885D|nr:hypothetical protein [Micromonospora salmantinae]MCG5454496.1 hypothetical protein [Micromonospora salmantinae]